MLKIAQVEDGKIVNISLWEKAPKGKQYLDVTAVEHAAIGDEVIKGKVVSQHALKDLDAAKGRCADELRKRYHHADGHQVQGFRVDSLPQLYPAYELMDNASAITIKNDEGHPLQLTKAALLNIMEQLFQHRKDATKTYADMYAKLAEAKSVAVLAKSFPELFPAHMVHPEAQ